MSNARQTKVIHYAQLCYTCQHGSADPGGNRFTCDKKQFGGAQDWQFVITHVCDLWKSFREKG